MDEERITLDSFGRLWTRPDQLPEVVGYEERAERIASHLRNASKKSFVIVGDAGVGKTSILYSAFRRLLADGWTILDTSTAEMTRGAVFIGEWQKALTQLMGLVAASGKILIYNSDIHNLRGAGAHSKSDADMAGAISVYLDRGEAILVGECSQQAFSRGIETCPELKRQLTVFQVVPPTKEDVFRHIKFAFEKLAKEVEIETGYCFELPDTTISSLEQLGDAFYPGTAQPGASIELLQKIVELKQKEVESNRPSSDSPIDLTHADIVVALHRISGLPLHLLDDNIPLNLKKTRGFFDSRVVGQDAALKVITDLITLIKAGLTDPGKPTGVMFFAGPTGVGKTELAKALAEYLFGSADRMIRCDMSEYKDYNSYEKFIGRPGKESDPASLVSRVRREPFSIILLDEVEKAHREIFDVLLQAFDDGRLTDPNGNTTDLTQTIIIMTTNLGSDLSVPSAVGFDSPPPNSDELVEKALRGYFKPELLNRVDHIIQFQALQRDHIRTLAKRELGKALLRNGLMRRELRVSVEPEVHDLLAREGYSPLYGARPLRRKVEELAILPVARKIIGLGNTHRGALLRLAVQEGTLRVQLVEDRQTKMAQRIARGIEVIDPIDGAKAKVSLSDAEELLKHIGVTAAGMQARLSEEELDERKSELLERSHASDFWDNQSEARATLNEIYRLERLIGAVHKVKDRQELLKNRFESIAGEPDEGKIRKLIGDLRSTNHFSTLVAYALECRSNRDRRDTFVAITLVGDPAEIDPVYQLTNCYRQWARRKDYTFRIIHEEETDTSTLREVVFELGGPAAYGIFQAEEGEHEFIEERTSKHPKRNHFVCVRVLGNALQSRASKTTLKMKRLKRKSKFEGNLRTGAVLSDPESGRSIEIESPLEGDELEEAGSSLLEAEIEHSSESQRTDQGKIIRRYVMNPSPSVRDQRIPDLKISPRDFWKGNLDAILQAGIEARNNPNEPDAKAV